MTITNIEKKESSVILKTKPSLSIIEYPIEINLRYIFYIKSRWNETYLGLEDYFIKNGKRGCLYGSGEDFIKNNIYQPHKPSDIMIWDMSKVFDGVDFPDLSESEMYMIVDKIIAGELEDYGFRFL